MQTKSARITYTRIELSSEPSGALAYQKFIDGAYVGIVRTVPPTHCENCGDRKPAGQSCGCFAEIQDDDDDDNDDQCPECARSYGPHYRGTCRH